VREEEAYLWGERRVRGQRLGFPWALARRGRAESIPTVLSTWRPTAGSRASSALPPAGTTSALRTKALAAGSRKVSKNGERKEYVPFIKSGSRSFAAPCVLNFNTNPRVLAKPRPRYCPSSDGSAASRWLLRLLSWCSLIACFFSVTNSCAGVTDRTATPVMCLLYWRPPKMRQTASMGHLSLTNARSMAA